MSKKLKFKPVISRVKLNPEQAVLTCECYGQGLEGQGTFNESVTEIPCQLNTKITFPSYEPTGSNVATS